MATTIKQEISEPNKSEFQNGKEEFPSLDISAFGDGIKSCSVISLEGGLLTDPDTCGLCGERLTLPRVLSCLHVFCERCLDKELIDEAGDSGSPETTVTCPTCNQDTKVGNKKLAALPMDVTTINVLDVSNASSLQCTSCTFKEVALSRCCTCHNLLCYNCDKAHRFMRCFEHHTVISLEDLRKDGKKITVHKPLTCDTHANEHVLFYCSTCDMPVCGECTKTEHKQNAGHQCESILDSEVRVRQEIEGMLRESKTKLEQLGNISGEVHTYLEELGNQRSTAKDLINESYQSYKALLEQCRDDALKELRDIYQERELKLMDLTEKVGRNSSLLEDACKFTSRLLENGTIAEIMYLRKTVGNQLASLNGKTPRPEKGGYSIEFRTDFDEFKRTLKGIFGKFHTETCNGIDGDLKNGTLSTSPTNSAISLPPLVTNGTLSNGSTTIRSPVPTTSPTMALAPPPSAASTFDGDLATSLQNLSLAQAAAAAAAASSPPASAGPQAPMTPTDAALQGFSSIAEYNIAQLASIAENNAAAAAVVANVAAASPPPSFTTLADLFTTDTAYKNLASLAKLGLANSTENAISNGNILMRSNSPGALNIPNTLMNGFSGVSSTSPLMTTADEMMADPLNAIVSQQGNGAGAAAAGAQNAVSGVGPLVTRTNKVSPMQIRCKFGQLGPSKGQFNSPHGFCLGLEEDIIVADTNNHRIQVFEKTGTFKFQFGIPGKDEGQLWYPRKVAVMRASGKYVVCDRGNERSRMQIFTKNGHFVKKIAIRYIDIVAGLAVTAHGEIVAVDSVSPTVFVISENGDLLRWFDCSDYMREPSDIAIHGKEYYVCDFKGHNVVVFSEDGAFIRRIGCENLTNFPNGIDISDAGDVLIGDSHGNRFHVAVFSRDGSLISEFECPYVKVSRCCGLKITSEGYVVTLAKNNHHVLVLNTLYIL